MNRVNSILYCAVLFALAFPGSVARAQFGGQGAAERAAIANKELQSAIDRTAVIMANAAHEDAPAKAPTQSCVCVGEAESPFVARIQEALAAPLHSTGLDFNDTPLEEVVNLLQEDYDIPVQLDTPALEENGLGPDEPVTVNLHNISLRSALRLMLKQLDLTYIIANEVLIVTTPDAAESELTVCVYDVRDLIDANQPKAVHALVEAIVSCVATETWAAHGGGEAEIRPLPPSFLVISQTQAVHEEIRGLLAAIREMRGRPAAVEAAAAEPLREPQPAEESSIDN